MKPKTSMRSSDLRKIASTPAASFRIALFCPTWQFTRYPIRFCCSIPPLTRQGSIYKGWAAVSITAFSLSLSRRRERSVCWWDRLQSVRKGCSSGVGPRGRPAR